MEALLRIRTKDGSEVLNQFDAVFSNKKKQPKVKQPKVKQPKVKQPKVKQPKVKEPKVKEPKVKVPKGVSVTKKNGEFSKFTPIKTPTAPAPPVPWEDENMDELASDIHLENSGKFETENDIYLKQDLEWSKLMKDIDVINDDDDDASSEVLDDTSSEVPEDDASSDVPEDDMLSELLEDDTSSDINIDDYSSDVSIDSELEECNMFYNYTTKGSKEVSKTKKIYSGVPIDFDDDDW
jgi:hypothetical protein